MSIFQVLPAEGGQWLIPDDVACDQLHRLVHEPEAAVRDWVPLQVALLKRERGRRRRAVDMPWLSATLLTMTRPAFDILAPVIGSAVVQLPIECPDLDVVALWPRTVDALDERLSNVIRFESGRLMDIERHVFLEDALAAATIFRLPQFGGGGPAYVTHPFAMFLDSAGLSGWNLRPMHA